MKAAERVTLKQQLPQGNGMKLSQKEWKIKKEVATTTRPIYKSVRCLRVPEL